MNMNYMQQSRSAAPIRPAEVRTSAIQLYLFGVLWVLLSMPASVRAQSSPPYVVEGPTIIQNNGCKLLNENFGGGKLTTQCVSISYDTSQLTSASIAQKRFVFVPRGNLLFEFPVVSNLQTSHGRLNVDYEVTVTVNGPNPNETTTNTGSVTLNGKSSMVLQVPINVDWAESVVTFQIALEQEIINGPCDPKPNCFSASGQFPGPDLSAISLQAIDPSPVPMDGFLVIATPAAGFQLPILPTAIIYSPLGNGSQAQSSFTVTEIVGTNQQFVNSTDQTHGITNDDKTQYQAGITLSIGYDRGGGDSKDDSNIVCGKDTTCKLSLGANYSESWDHSTETDNELTYGKTGSVVTQNQMQVTYSAIPVSKQPSIDQITWETQPFWRDYFLAVTDAQYAVWDYPAGAVIQPLGSASVVHLPVQQLDSCKNAPQAIEPASLVPAQWAPNQVITLGTVLVDSNNEIQVATSGGKTGATPPLPQWQAYHTYSANTVIVDGLGNKQTVTKAGLSNGAAPVWNPAAGQVTSDGSVIWTNGGPAKGWGLNYGDQTSDGAVVWTNRNDGFGMYKSSVAQDAARFVQLRSWSAGQTIPTGAVIVTPGLGSIQVATKGGTSGAVAPVWNTADQGITTDGAVTWTNEQEHFVVYAGQIVQRASVYQWLSSENCTDILSLDQFYSKGAQSAYPTAYRVLGNQLSISPPSNPITYSNQNQTATSRGQSSTSKQSTTVTSVYSNSLGATGALDFGLKVASFVLGVDVTGGVNQNSTTTTVDATVDSQTLESSKTATGQWVASTTIQDSGNEKSIPVNVLQDTIFMGLAVQDPAMNPARPGTSGPILKEPAAQTSATNSAPPQADVLTASSQNVPESLHDTPIVPIGQSVAIFRKPGSPEPTTFALQTNYGYVITVSKPTNAAEVMDQLKALHATAASRHVTRTIPAPLPARIRPLTRQQQSPKSVDGGEK
jgi:hypothetical protein